MSSTKPKSRFNITIVPGSSLPGAPWWPDLHRMINEAYEVKDVYIFPQTWTRLNLDPVKGAQSLANELGDNGHFAIAFTEEDQPVACGGVLPYRGDNWINEAFKKTKTDRELANGQSNNDVILDWETCCWCVHPSGRGQWLSHQILEKFTTFLRGKGAKRLFTNYVRDETGAFWPKLGFEVVPGVGSSLPKGFKRNADDVEGLRMDVEFALGVKDL